MGAVLEHRYLPAGRPSVPNMAPEAQGAADSPLHTMTRMDVWNGHRVAWMPGPPSTAESACGQLAAPRVRPTPVPGFPGPLTASGRPLVCGLPRLAPSIPGSLLPARELAQAARPGRAGLSPGQASGQQAAHKADLNRKVRNYTQA